MRRVILAIAATALGLVLLLSFKSHTQSAVSAAPSAALGTPTPGEIGTPTPGESSAAPAASAGGSRSSTVSPGTPRAGSTTVTGAAWPTVYGPVQVRITVSGGKITAAAATEYPTETERDAQINAYAIPELNAEAVAAGNAKIDAVSGATYTSQGYLGSLQSALDKAGSA